MRSFIIKITLSCFLFASLHSAGRTTPPKGSFEEKRISAFNELASAADMPTESSIMKICASIESQMKAECRPSKKLVAALHRYKKEATERQIGTFSEEDEKAIIEMLIKRFPTAKITEKQLPMTHKSFALWKSKDYHSYLRTMKWWFFNEVVKHEIEILLLYNTGFSEE